MIKLKLLLRLWAGAVVWSVAIGLTFIAGTHDPTAISVGVIAFGFALPFVIATSLFCFAFGETFLRYRLTYGTVIPALNAFALYVLVPWFRPAGGTLLLFLAYSLAAPVVASLYIWPIVSQPYRKLSSPDISRVYSDDPP